MLGLNRRIIAALHDAATNALGSSPSCNAAFTILDTLKTHRSISCFNTFAFSNQFSTLSAFHTAALKNQKLSPSRSRLFSTNSSQVASTKTSSNVIPRKSGRNTHQGGPSSEGSSTSWARYLLAVPPVICAGLCKWQLERRQWKIDLLERRQRIMKGEPVDIFSDSISYPEEYQRVIATGIFDEARTQYIGPRPRSRMGTTEVGYLAVTPLIFTEEEESTANRKKKLEITSGGNRREILVLRGWVPSSWRDSTNQQQQQQQSSSATTATTAPAVTIQGVVRFGEDPGTFVPDNKPEDGTWFYLNSEELADAVGLPRGTPLVEMISPEEQVKMLDSGPTVLDVLGGRGKLSPAPEEVYPLAKSEGDMGAFSVMPRDHLNYALTWFTLMFATGGMAAIAMRRGRKSTTKLTTSR